MSANKLLKNLILCPQLPGGATFLGSSPEQLYARAGACIASEAVAATRPRGPPGDLPGSPCPCPPRCTHAAPVPLQHACLNDA